MADDPGLYCPLLCGEPLIWNAPTDVIWCPRCLGQWHRKAGSDA